MSKSTTPAPTTFGGYLKQAIADCGFSKADLARASGVDATTIGRWIADDREPTINGLRSIAPHLGVPLADLVVGAGLFSAEELETAGPLPAQVRRVMTALSDPQYTERQKAALLAGIDRTTDSWEEIVHIPREPQMRKRPAKR